MDLEKINNKKIAEFIGILLGDGSLCLKDGKNNTNNRLKITFNSKDDKEYIYYVKNLIKELFGIDPILKFRTNENTADLFLFRKEMIIFLTEKVGLKLSPKWNRAMIPAQFLADELDVCVLRGCFDTDGCLVTTNNNGIKYPRLELKICPSPMQNQFIEILKKYNFKFGIYQVGKGEVRIQLNGKKQLQKWIELVGFSNEKHINKIKRFV